MLDSWNVLFFSNECNFSLCGRLNKQNCRIWGSEPPNELYETLHNSPTITIWCTLSRNEIIGNVTGRTYNRMLRYFLSPKNDRCPEDLIFQQDGAPPDYSLKVREYLNRNLRINGCAGVDQFHGLHALQTYLLSITSNGHILKIKVTKSPLRPWESSKIR